MKDPFWEKTVAVFDEKSVRNWISGGLPVNRIASVAVYFGVSRVYFTDKSITDALFERAIAAAFETKRDGTIIPPPAMDTKPGVNSTRAIRLAGECALDWFEQHCPYHSVEKLFKRLHIDLHATTPFEDIDDPRLLTFLMVSALHFGANWAYWIKRNLESDQALALIVRLMGGTLFDRPRLRIIYTLQKFPRDRVRGYLDTDIDPDFREVLTRYILKDKSLDYILLQRSIIPKKVNVVLKELVDYWQEKIPGFGLFGLSN